MKVFLINFCGFTRLWYSTNYTLTVIKSIAKISYIDSYVLFRTRVTVKFSNSKICVSIYNSFTNIVLIPISVFRLTCFFNILVNLATFSITSGTFTFSSIFVSSFCSYEIVLKSASFTPASRGRLISKNSFVFLIRRNKYLCLILNLKISENLTINFSGNLFFLFFFSFLSYSWQGIYMIISISTYHDLILVFST